MAVCMESRTDNYIHGASMMPNSYYPSYTYDAFDSDFYKCLCEDLAKELDFPDETDLRRISQLELFGSSWETDPYKKLLLRCLDHSIPRLREPLPLPRSRGGSVDFSVFSDENPADLDSDVEDESLTVPTVPPPSPILSAMGGEGDSSGQDPPFFNDFHFPQSTDAIDGGKAANEIDDDDSDDEEDNQGDAAAYFGLAASEITEARRIRRQQPQVESPPRHYHRRVASTGLLATVVTGDGSIIWHFKEFS
ncbi:hypothetical protein TWF694_003433 [Orbilia ellipsospora]|uniref:Uncharacterized protein n=1 Tax=Orbilia ellipsospora TaxID=2528407 RepID=A0AAV9WZC1_9PEZI